MLFCHLLAKNTPTTASNNDFVLDPVPGACNTEFNLELDPNIYIHYNIYETTISFAPANLGRAR